MEIEEYDQWTIHYLRGVGVSGALLERVERLARDHARYKAEATRIVGRDGKDQLGIVGGVS